MFFRLAAEYADRQGVTGPLKSENPFLWIQKMNNILACTKTVCELKNPMFSCIIGKGS
ncbi:MAG: TnpV protein [Lachnospiraceae bacterium]|nr:TnpV protein [Lachnospiraceae bacterium]